MTATDETFRVWVGCLACYNEGRLVGEWFDASDAPQEMDDFLTHVKHRASFPPHEELWCFDTENSPVSGEMSPMDAAKYAELIEDLPIPLEALVAWLAGQHEELTEESVATAAERYWCHGDEAFDDSLSDLYPRDGLPEWAKTGYYSIIADIKRDMRLNGEYVELKGYYFRTY